MTIPMSHKGVPVAEAFLGSVAMTAPSIPDSVTEIGAHAFESCEKIRTVTIGNGIGKIGDQYH